MATASSACYPSDQGVYMQRRLLSSFVVAALAASCADPSSPKRRDAPPPPEPCAAHADCSEATPYCDEEAAQCVEPPPGSELGWGGDAPAPALTLVLQDASLRRPVDLAFNPSIPTELWVLNQQDDSVVILQEPGTPAMAFVRKKDPAAGHFMNNPPALAMGSVDETWGQTFGTCGDHDNHDDFIGPALFPTASDVFAVQTPGGLGSHLDMLHSTRYCRGIAHVEANVYFVFNADVGSLDRYDFTHDHGPGADDHEDGTILRYATGQVTGVVGVPSHVAYDASTRTLYVADTGTGRLIALDTTSGVPGSSFGGMEIVAERRAMEGAVLTEIVGPGTLSQPSGLEVHRDSLFVSDHQTSALHALAMDGSVIRTLETGLPPGSLAGLTFGPDGKVYFVDMLAGAVYRVDPRG